MTAAELLENTLGPHQKRIVGKQIRINDGLSTGCLIAAV